MSRGEIKTRPGLQFSPRNSLEITSLALRVITGPC